MVRRLKEFCQPQNIICICQLSHVLLPEFHPEVHKFWGLKIGHAKKNALTGHFAPDLVVDSFTFGRPDSGGKAPTGKPIFV
jgi:hypothetical protein